jgi:hypothetical protein
MSTYYHGVEYWSYSSYEQKATKDQMNEQYLNGKLFWTTRENEHINVRDLTDKHIDNILNRGYFKFHEIWKNILTFEKINVRKITT